MYCANTWYEIETMAVVTIRIAHAHIGINVPCML